MSEWLWVAAGGGGDAIGAAMVHDAIAGAQPRPRIATYAWERLVVDPLPGPRGPAAFEGLTAIGELNWRIDAGSRPVPPAGSSLPRLSAELDAELYLLDPVAGAVGLAKQLRELMGLLEADRLGVVDVGGDVLARGDEDSLRSPLADALALAAAATVDPQADIFVIGPGLDGELDEREVTRRLLELGATRAGELRATDVRRYGSIMEWHPSEANALTWCAACGYRGTVEIRDGGTPVLLTDASETVWRASVVDVLDRGALAASLTSTNSLAEVERVLEDHGAPNELVYERVKAARRPVADGGAFDADALAATVAEAATRGAKYISVRRLLELLHLPVACIGLIVSELRLSNSAFQPPLWPLLRDHD